MDLLSHIELATGADPQGTVIWMHGLGADGWDFVPIVRELDLPEELPLRFIFPNAPVRPVSRPPASPLGGPDVMPDALTRSVPANIGLQQDR